MKITPAFAVAAAAISSPLVHGFAPMASSRQATPLALSMASSSSDDATLVGRRQALSAFAAAVVAAGVVVPHANAIDACPKGSKNCLRQTWTPPSGKSAADAAANLRAALNEYPPEGLDGGKVDGGGYKVVQDGLGDGKAIALEYRSSGKGTFAKLFNGGSAFVDDLVIEPNGSSFEFRSSSRVGESDFGVNEKRLGYIAGLLKGMGWSGVGVAN